MKIKFSRRIILTILSSLVLFIYVNAIEPDIEKPVTIAGFFIVLGMCLNSWIYVLLRWTKRVSSPLYKSSLFTLAGLYLLALKSIESLDWLDILVVVVVVGLIIQIMGVRKSK